MSHGGVRMGSDVPVCNLLPLNLHPVDAEFPVEHGIPFIMFVFASSVIRPLPDSMCSPDAVAKSRGVNEMGFVYFSGRIQRECVCPRDSAALSVPQVKQVERRGTKCDASNVENSRRAIPDFIVLRSRHPGRREGKGGCFWLSKSTIRTWSKSKSCRAVHLTWALKQVQWPLLEFPGQTPTLGNRPTKKAIYMKTLITPPRINCWKKR
jgi:hypothetical protein